MSSETDVTIQIEQKRKPNVTVSQCKLPAPIDAEVVRLDVHKGAEKRFRLRFEGGVESRITTSKDPHYQAIKRHKNVSLYVVHRGWLCALWEDSGVIQHRFAFAKHPGGFYLETPGNTWYAMYLSEDAAYTYTSSDTETGDLDGKTFDLPTEQELIKILQGQNQISAQDVQDMIERSYRGE